MSSGKEKIELRLLTLKDKRGRQCPPILRDIIKLAKMRCSEYHDEEFDWDEVEKEVLMVAKEVQCEKNGAEIKRLIEEYEAPIESRLDILDL